MNQYYTVEEMAKKWNLTRRQIQNLCKNGLLDGAFKFGNSWAIPMDAKRPDDHRLREFKTANQGFSLMELIVVLSIMAVLTGFMAPSLLRYIEKSRESVDINNVHAAYQEVKMAAIMQDRYAYFNGQPIYDEANDLYTIYVPLKQASDGWSSSEVKRIEGITSLDANWIGDPTAKGYCAVTLNSDGYTQINWNGEVAPEKMLTVSLNKRWKVSYINGAKYISTSCLDFTDGYKGSSMNEFVKVEAGNRINLAPLSNAGDTLDTSTYNYTMGYFIVDANSKSGDNVKVLQDSGEQAYGNDVKYYTVNNNFSGDLRVAVQLFKKNKSDNKTVDLTKEEAVALINLISIS